MLESTGRWIRNSLEFNKIGLISSPLKREQNSYNNDFIKSERSFSFVELKRNEIEKEKEKKNGGEHREKGKMN